MKKYILLFLLLFNSLALLAQERADHPVKGYHAFIDGGFNTAIGSVITEFRFLLRMVFS